jgi:small-conductance mechanosensitive channel
MKNDLLISLGIPVAIVVAGAFLGVLFRRLALARLRRIAARTRWRGDDVITASLRGEIVLLFAVAGVYVALETAPVPENVASVAQRFAVIILILSATLFAARMTTGLLSLYGDRGGPALPSTSILVNFTRIVVFVVGFLVILQTLGISITPLLTALGVGGLAVALALQDTLSNLFAGLHIILSRKIRPGDYIRLDSGEDGYVEDIHWRETTIRALRNNVVVVPNSKLASSITTNYHLPETPMSVLVEVGVSYDSDLERVEQVSLDIARQVVADVEGGYPEFDPLLRYKSFSDFSIDFVMILRVREYANQFVVRHEFIKRLHRRFNEEGIVIPFPIRTVEFRGTPPHTD